MNFFGIPTLNIFIQNREKNQIKYFSTYIKFLKHGIIILHAYQQK